MAVRIVEGDGMGLFGDKVATGNGVRGPAADLIELDGGDGGGLLALWFREEHLEDPVLHDGVQAVLAFLQMPMVAGIAELTDWDEAEALFVYNTGEVWSLAEVALNLRELDELMAPRAVGELVLKVTGLLVAAAEAGADQGVPSHGALNPWRVALTADGDVRLLGHGVLQPEFSRFHTDEEYLPSARSLRYAPPERFAREPEDQRSDLFSLGLVALELLSGEPVYLGKADEVLEQAQDGATAEVIDEVGGELPELLVELLRRMLAPAIGDRPAPDEVIDALVAEVDGLEGEDLAELMSRMVEVERLADVELPEGEATADPAAEDPAEAEPEQPAVDEAELEQAAKDAQVSLERCTAEVDGAKQAWAEASAAIEASDDADVAALRDEIVALLAEGDQAISDVTHAKAVTDESDVVEDVFEAADLAVEVWEGLEGLGGDVQDKIDAALAKVDEAAAAEEKAAEEAAAAEAAAAEEAARKAAEEKAAADAAAAEEAARKEAEEKAAVEAIRADAAALIAGFDGSLDAVSASAEQAAKAAGERVEVADMAVAEAQAAAAGAKDALAALDDAGDPEAADELREQISGAVDRVQAAVVAADEARDRAVADREAAEAAAAEAQAAALAAAREQVTLAQASAEGRVGAALASAESVADGDGVAAARTALQAALDGVLSLVVEEGAPESAAGQVAAAVERLDEAETGLKEAVSAAQTAQKAKAEARDEAVAKAAGLEDSVTEARSVLSEVPQGEAVSLAEPIAAVEAAIEVLVSAIGAVADADDPLAAADVARDAGETLVQARTALDAAVAEARAQAEAAQAALIAARDRLAEARTAHEASVREARDAHAAIETELDDDRVSAAKAALAEAVEAAVGWLERVPASDGDDPEPLLRWVDDEARTGALAALPGAVDALKQAFASAQADAASQLQAVREALRALGKRAKAEAKRCQTAWAAAAEGFEGTPDIADEVSALDVDFAAISEQADALVAAGSPDGLKGKALPELTAARAESEAGWEALQAQTEAWTTRLQALVAKGAELAAARKAAAEAVDTAKGHLASIQSLVGEATTHRDAVRSAAAGSDDADLAGLVSDAEAADARLGTLAEQAAAAIDAGDAEPEGLVERVAAWLSETEALAASLAELPSRAQARTQEIAQEAAAQAAALVAQRAALSDAAAGIHKALAAASDVAAQARTASEDWTDNAAVVAAVEVLAEAMAALEGQAGEADSWAALDDVAVPELASAAPTHVASATDAAEGVQRAAAALLAAASTAQAEAEAAQTAAAVQAEADAIRSVSGRLEALSATLGERAAHSEAYGSLLSDRDGLAKTVDGLNKRVTDGPTDDVAGLVAEREAAAAGLTALEASLAEVDQAEVERLRTALSHDGAPWEAVLDSASKADGPSDALAGVTAAAEELRQALEARRDLAKQGRALQGVAELAGVAGEATQADGRLDQARDAVDRAVAALQEAAAQAEQQERTRLKAEISSCESEIDEALVELAALADRAAGLEGFGQPVVAEIDTVRDQLAPGDPSGDDLAAMRQDLAAAQERKDAALAGLEEARQGLQAAQARAAEAAQRREERQAQVAALQAQVDAASGRVERGRAMLAEAADDKKASGYVDKLAGAVDALTGLVAELSELPLDGSAKAVRNKADKAEAKSERALADLQARLDDLAAADEAARLAGLQERLASSLAAAVASVSAALDGIGGVDDADALPPELSGPLISLTSGLQALRERADELGASGQAASDSDGVRPLVEAAEALAAEVETSVGSADEAVQAARDHLEQGRALEAARAAAIALADELGGLLDQARQAGEALVGQTDGAPDAAVSAQAVVDAAQVRQARADALRADLGDALDPDGIAKVATALKSAIKAEKKEASKIARSSVAKDAAAERERRADNQAGLDRARSGVAALQAALDALGLEVEAAGDDLGEAAGAARIAMEAGRAALADLVEVVDDPAWGGSAPTSALQERATAADKAAKKAIDQSRSALADGRAQARVAAEQAEVHGLRTALAERLAQAERGLKSAQDQLRDALPEGLALGPAATRAKVAAESVLDGPRQAVEALAAATEQATGWTTPDSARAALDALPEVPDPSASIGEALAALAAARQEDEAAESEALASAVADLAARIDGAIVPADAALAESQALEGDWAAHTSSEASRVVYGQVASAQAGVRDGVAAARLLLEGSSKADNVDAVHSASEALADVELRLRDAASALRDAVSATRTAIAADQGEAQARAEALRQRRAAVAEAIATQRQRHGALAARLGDLSSKDAQGGLAEAAATLESAAGSLESATDLAAVEAVSGSVDQVADALGSIETAVDSAIAQAQAAAEAAMAEALAAVRAEAAALRDQVRALDHDDLDPVVVAELGILRAEAMDAVDAALAEDTVDDATEWLGTAREAAARLMEATEQATASAEAEAAQRLADTRTALQSRLDQAEAALEAIEGDASAVRERAAASNLDGQPLAAALTALSAVGEELRQALAEDHPPEVEGDVQAAATEAREALSALEQAVEAAAAKAELSGLQEALAAKRAALDGLTPAIGVAREDLALAQDSDADAVTANAAALTALVDGLESAVAAAAELSPILDELPLDEARQRVAAVPDPEKLGSELDEALQRLDRSMEAATAERHAAARQALEAALGEFVRASEALQPAGSAPEGLVAEQPEVQRALAQIASLTAQHAELTAAHEGAAGAVEDAEPEALSAALEPATDRLEAVRALGEAWAAAHEALGSVTASAAARLAGQTAEEEVAALEEGLGDVRARASALRHRLDEATTDKAQVAAIRKVLRGATGGVEDLRYARARLDAAVDPKTRLNLLQEAAEAARSVGAKLSEAEASIAAMEAEAEEARLAAERAAAEAKAEEERLAAEAKAEEERLAAEAKAAEEARLAAEAKAEEERLAAEAKAEEERLAAEAKAAEEERLAAEAKAEEERLAAEAKAEEERLAAEAKAAEEERLAAEAKAAEAKAEAERLAAEAIAEEERVADEAPAPEPAAADQPDRSSRLARLRRGRSEAGEDRPRRRTRRTAESKAAGEGRAERLARLRRGASGSSEEPRRRSRRTPPSEDAVKAPRADRLSKLRRGSQAAADDQPTRRPRRRSQPADETEGPRARLRRLRRSAPDDGESRPRRRTRRSESSEAESRPRRRVRTPDADGESGRDRLRRLRRSSADAATDEPARPARRTRRARSGGAEGGRDRLARLRRGSKQDEEAEE